MPRNVMPPRLEEELNGDTEHSMPLARRPGGLIQTNINPLNRRGSGGAWAIET